MSPENLYVPITNQLGHWNKVTVIFGSKRPQPLHNWASPPKRSHQYNPFNSIFLGKAKFELRYRCHWIPHEPSCLCHLIVQFICATTIFSFISRRTMLVFAVCGAN